MTDLVCRGVSNVPSITICESDLSYRSARDIACSAIMKHDRGSQQRAETEVGRQTSSGEPERMSDMCCNQ